MFQETETRGLFKLQEGVCKVSINEAKVSDLVDNGFSYVNRNITDRNFPVRPENFGEQEIMFYRPSIDGISTGLIFEVASERTLKRPFYEGAFFFGAERFLNFNVFCEIVFLHNPVLINGRGRVITLSNSRMGKEIYLHPFEVKWPKSTMFAFFC